MQRGDGVKIIKGRCTIKHETGSYPVSGRIMKRQNTARIGNTKNFTAWNIQAVRQRGDPGNLVACRGRSFVAGVGKVGHQTQQPLVT